MAVSAFRAAVRLHAIHHNGDEPSIEARPWLEFRGRATDSIKDVHDVRISMYPEDELRVGAARPPPSAPSLLSPTTFRTFSREFLATWA